MGFIKLGISRTTAFFVHQTRSPSFDQDIHNNTAVYILPAHTHYTSTIAASSWPEFLQFIDQKLETIDETKCIWSSQRATTRTSIWVGRISQYPPHEYAKTWRNWELCIAASTCAWREPYSRAVLYMQRVENWTFWLWSWGFMAVYCLNHYGI